MSAQRYLVTARKYRPQLFRELVAQEHVTETLKNAIRLDRLAHAYLFSGPRGVGKTTAARILAKAINCTAPLEDRDSEAEPCRQCESCQTFEQGRSLNIIEIDAASNNRVDDIRDLRETVRIPPQGGRKKVYIVDEVHMLSTAAFNALLKTLEEPPPHVLFIFATTEPHKVLPTILSRCQRFDFRRIAVPEIVGRLDNICEEEDIQADEASLMLIARKGDGALRDALSVFDQAVSLCGTDITYSSLAQALGVVDVDRYFEVTDLIAERDAAGMLRLVERTVRAGHDLQEFLAGLAEHVRNLLVAGSMEDLDLIEAAEATRQRYLNASKAFSETDLLRLLTLAADAEDAIKGSTQPRLKVETVLLKMASVALGADLREVIGKIERLEAMAREGKLPSGDISAPPSEGESGSGDGSGQGQNSARGGADSGGGADSDRHPGQGPESGNAERGGDADGGQPDSEKAGRRPPGSETTGDRRSASETTGGKRSDREARGSGSPGETAGAEGDSGSGASERRRGGTNAVANGQRASANSSRQSVPTIEPQQDETVNGSDTQSASKSTSNPGPAKIGGTENPPTDRSTVERRPPSAADGVLGTPALRRRSSTAATSRPGTNDMQNPSDAPSDAGPITRIWSDLLERVKHDKIQVWSLLHHTEPEDFDDGAVRIAVPNDFHRRVLTSQASYVRGHLEPLVDESIRSLSFSVRDEMQETDSKETASDFDPYEYMKRKRQENPVVRAIFEQFGGELVW